MEHDANPSRRRLIASAAGAAGALTAAVALGRGLGGGSAFVGASGAPSEGGAGGVSTASIGRAARASSPAERLRLQPGEPDAPAAGRIAFPVDPAADSFVLDNFGDCRGGGSRRHQGLDIISERGVPVFAVASGRLSQQYTNTGTAGYGWTLRAADGSSYRYFHLDSFAEGLRRDDEVVFGQVIGYVGSTGNFIWVDGERVEDRSNIHLHFEVLRDHRRAVDPLPLIEVPDGISIGAPLKSCLHVG